MIQNRSMNKAQVLISIKKTSFFFSMIFYFLTLHTIHSMEDIADPVKQENMESCDLSMKNLPPKEWESLVKSIPLEIKSLSLFDCNYQGEAIENIHLLENLDTCHICFVSHPEILIPILLDNLPETLSFLSIGAQRSFVPIGKKLARFKELSKLNLKNVKYPENEWASIINNLSTTLEEIDFTYSNYGGQNLRKLLTKTFLKRLDLTGTNLSNNHIEHIHAHLKTHTDTIIIKFSDPNKVSEMPDVDDEKYDDTNDDTNDDKAGIKQELKFPSDFSGLELSLVEWKNQIEQLPLNTKEISFAQSNYSGNNSEVFQTLTDLNKIDFSGCSIPKRNWKKILLSLPESLETLILDDSEYYGEYNIYLERLKNLNEISLQFIHMDQRGWADFFRYLQGKKMTLHLGGSNVLDALLFPLFREYAKFYELWQQKPGCTTRENPELQSTLKTYNWLSYVSSSIFISISNIDCISFSGSSDIENVNYFYNVFSGARGARGEGIKRLILKQCNNLKSVCLKHYYDGRYNSRSPEYPLEYLDLEYCTNVTCVDLSACKQLKTVNLKGCTNLKDLILPSKSVNVFKEGCDKLPTG